MSRTVPPPANQSRGRRAASSGHQPPGPPRRWFDRWGAAIFVSLTNIIVVTVIASFVMDTISERMDGVEDGLDELTAITGSVNNEIAQINVNHARIDTRLTGLERHIEKLTTTIDTVNDAIIRMSIEVEER